MQSFPSLLQQLDENERTLMTLLRHQGASTRQELRQRSGFSTTTLHRAVGLLEEKRLIRAIGEAGSSGGRKPLMYDVSNENGVLIGVELSRTEVRILFCRPDLSVLEMNRFGMDGGYGPEKTVDVISGLIKDRLQQLGLSREEVPGIGLGTVGPLDRESGCMLKPVGFFHDGWRNVPIVSMLEKQTGLSVHLDNGANMAVLAEWLSGSGKDHESVVLVHLGMGIRTGIISSGRVVRPFENRDDAFGHMVVSLNGEPCHCGNHGCVETYAALPSLAQRIGMKQDFSFAIQNAETYHSLLEQVELVGGSMREALETSAAAFGTGLANLIRLTDPGMVILSGPLVRMSTYFYEHAVNAARKELGYNRGGVVSFVRDGRYGRAAIATGAAAYVFSQCLLAERNHVLSMHEHAEGVFG